MAKDSPRKTFVLSDESVNSFGFRVLTAGIDLERFKNNPIMLWNHTRSHDGKQDNILPIGRWENLRIEDGKLLGDTCFDMDDDFAVKIANKVNNGFIKTCSIGIDPIELNNEFVEGQTRKTVAKCLLVECSIADIPSNANSVSLFNKSGKRIELTAESVDCTIGTINNNVNKNNTEMKLIALKFGLGENATEAEILAKYDELQISLSAKDTEIATLKANAAEAEKKTIESIVNDAVVAKKLTADQKPHFITIGEKMGIESLKTTLASMNGAVKPTDVLSGASKSQSGDGKTEWSKLSAAERETLYSEDRETYKLLYKKEYGIEPKFE